MTPFAKPTRTAPMLLCAGLLVLVAGCGGGSGHKSSTTSLHAQCSAALVAAAEYSQAAKEFGLNFRKPTLLAGVQASSKNLRAALQTLAAKQQGAAHEQLVSFAGALSRQEQVLTKVATKELNGIGKLAKGLNTEIPQGTANLQRICAKA